MVDFKLFSIFYAYFLLSVFNPALRCSYFDSMMHPVPSSSFIQVMSVYASEYTLFSNSNIW